MAGLIQPRPHDLLRLAQPLDAVPEGAPPWVAAAMRVAPWTVVRRAAASEGRVAVGVRGTARAERFAMEIPETAVTEVLSPESLALRAATMRPVLPPARALRAAAALLDDAGLSWGPTGSVGFELASGMRTVTANSDLDLLLRPARLPARATLMLLHVALRRLPARVDCQLETDDGAIALGELLSGVPEVLVRTPTGPRIIPAPWPDAA
jgi:phosphoribosyl-dephospho-CoA transferase